MALGNYTWTARPGDRNRFSGATLYDESTGIMRYDLNLGPAEITTDQATGVVFHQVDAGLHVTPANTTFTGLHSGRFYFQFGPNGNDVNRSTFRFYKQKAGTDFSNPGHHFEFEVWRHQPGEGSLVGSINMALYHVFPSVVSGNSNRSTIFLCETGEVPGSTWCAGLEWATNDATQVDISDDLANPDFPDLAFVFRLNSTDHDPAGAQSIASINVDLQFLQNLDPDDDAFNLASALGTFGSGYWDYLKSLDPQFAGALGGAVFTGEPGLIINDTGGIITLPDGTVVPTGATFFAEFFQRMFALNIDREGEGFVPGSDGISGLIQPVEAEDWTVDGSCIGWQWDLLGFTELVIGLFPNEPWEPPDNGTPDEIIDETWEPPMLTPSTIHEETWES